MAKKTLQLDIVTPNSNVFSGEVESIVAPGTEGYFQLLPDHTPFLSTLQIGEIRIRKNGKEECYATSGGFAEVHLNRVSILAETAEAGSEIDLKRADAARRRAEKLLESHEEWVDTDRARLALFRALNRIRVKNRM